MLSCFDNSCCSINKMLASFYPEDSSVLSCFCGDCLRKDGHFVRLVLVFIIDRVRLLIPIPKFQ